MGRNVDGSGEDSKSGASLFAASDKAFDPGLASLFALSSGPVTLPKSIRIHSEAAPAPVGNQKSLTTDVRSEEQEDETSSSGSDSSRDSRRSELELSSSDEAEQELESPPRKRRRVAQGDDVETQYLSRLMKEEAKDESKRRKERRLEVLTGSVGNNDECGSSEDLGDVYTPEISGSENDPLHETLGFAADDRDLTKGARTVFLGNVSTEAIKSKSARKILENHLTSVLNNLPDHANAHKIESLRFRSTAFVSGAGPKKAAFAKRELMDQTTKGTNAYVVYSSELAARTSAMKLNGTVVLDRHLRADYLTNPAEIDHRRCIFVGNLSFVDEETAENLKQEADAQRRPKAKVPADAEEGLWRTFSKAGKVESVRVVRDKETRVGKGFAYVQFTDENAVESALLLNEKKFPPMLPRKLRVMRAKKTKRKPQAAVANGSIKDQNGRKRNNFLRSGSDKRSSAGFQRSKSFVFEGQRASMPSKGKDRSTKLKKRHGVKPATRSSRRGAAFKASGGKRKL